MQLGSEIFPQKMDEKSKNIVDECRNYAVQIYNKSIAHLLRCALCPCVPESSKGQSRANRRKSSMVINTVIPPVGGTVVIFK